MHTTTHSRTEVHDFSVVRASHNTGRSAPQPAIWLGHPTGGRWLSIEQARSIVHALLVACGPLQATPSFTPAGTTAPEAPDTPAAAIVLTSTQRDAMDETAGVQA